MPRVDVMICSLGGTAGLRAADEELAGSLRRAGATVELVRVPRVREWRTLAGIELAWAVSARRALLGALRSVTPRAVIYSSSTAALLGPVPGAIRFDAPAAGNRPGRHGLWQRPVERRRFASASLLVPWSEGGLAEAPSPHADAVVVPVGVSRSGPVGERDIAAITYGANPSKKGLDTVLAAWLRLSRPDETLVVAGLDEREGAAWLRAAAAAVAPPRLAGSSAASSPDPAAPGATAASLRGVAAPRSASAPSGGAVAPDASAPSTRVAPPGATGRVRFAGMLSRAEYRVLLRRSRVFLTAPRREDYGIAQLEALADGCLLVTTPAPGPYAALPLARELDPRLVADTLAIRTALDDPAPDYAARAVAALTPFTPAQIDRVVAERLLPRLQGWSG